MDIFEANQKFTLDTGDCFILYN